MKRANSRLRRLLPTYSNINKTYERNLDAHWDHRHNTHILWKIIHGLFNRAPPPTHALFGSKKIAVLPKYTSSFTLASSINMFFIEKIHKIKMEFPLLEAFLPASSSVDIDTIMPVCTTVFDTFQPHSCDGLRVLFIN